MEYKQANLTVPCSWHSNSCLTRTANIAYQLSSPQYSIPQKGRHPTTMCSTTLETRDPIVTTRCDPTCYLTQHSLIQRSNRSKSTLRATSRVFWPRRLPSERSKPIFVSAGPTTTLAKASTPRPTIYSLMVLLVPGGTKCSALLAPFPSKLSPSC